MTNPFYNPSGAPGTRSPGSSAAIRAELAAIGSAFDKFPPVLPLGMVRWNSAGSALEAVLAIDGVTIGLTTPAAAKFTTIDTSGFVTVGAPANGRVVLAPGNPTNTGYINFFAANDVRQGYIGNSTSTGSIDTGAINYIAGSHRFTGPIVGSLTGAASLNLALTGGTMTGLITSIAAGEMYRGVGSAPFYSGFNAANTLRTGYLQFIAGTSVLLKAEQTNSLVLSTSGGNLTIQADGSAAFSDAVTAPSFAGGGSGLTGTAAALSVGTAARLSTPRTINGVAFDGSANINISATAAASTLTGTTLATNVAASSLTSVGTLTDLDVAGPLNVGGIVRVGTAAGSGYSLVLPGNSSRSGYLGFFSANGNRQGYFGYSATAASTDAGVLNLVTGTLAIAGDVTADSFTGAHIGQLTGNVTGNVSGSSGSCTGNSASASAAPWTGITGRPINTIAMTTTTGTPAAAGVAGDEVFVY